MSKIWFIVGRVNGNNSGTVGIQNLSPDLLFNNSYNGLSGEKVVELAVDFLFIEMKYVSLYNYFGVFCMKDIFRCGITK